MTGRWTAADSPGPEHPVRVLQGAEQAGHPQGGDRQQRAALPSALQAIQQQCTQLMKTGERQLHLRFHPRGRATRISGAAPAAYSSSAD